MDLHLKPKHVLLALAGWSLAFSAAAQWQWIDKDGRKVFSDRPPGAEIKDKDILKQPGGRGRAPAAAPMGATDSADTGAAPAPASAANKPKADPTAPKISGKDAELQAKKKKLEEEEAAKKKAEEDNLAQKRTENCNRAKKNLASLQSGTRISSVNAKGEREFIDDNAKAAEVRHIQSVIDSDCKQDR